MLIVRMARFLLYSHSPMGGEQLIIKPIDCPLRYGKGYFPDQECHEWEKELVPGREKQISHRLDFQIEFRVGELTSKTFLV